MPLCCKATLLIVDLAAHVEKRRRKEANSELELEDGEDGEDGLASAVR